MRATLGRTLAAVGLAALLAAAPAAAEEGDVRLVAPDAEELSVSADGSVIAFSTTRVLVDEDVDGNQDVYVRVPPGGPTDFRLISRTLPGKSTDNFSDSPEISADGSTVAFHSLSDSLVPGDDNVREDVFVADVATGAIQRVNVRDDGTQAGIGGLPDARPSLSADGSQVAFTEKDRLTDDALLTSEGNVYVSDVAARTTRFVAAGSAASISGDGKLVAYQQGGQVYARTGDATELVSRGVGGERPDGDAETPDVNADGSQIAFASTSSNLVVGGDGAGNPGQDIFVLHRGPGSRTDLESRDDRSQPAKGWFSEPSISADGGVVAFRASADPNGCGEPDLPTVTVRDVAREATYSAARAFPGHLPDGAAGAPSVAAGGKLVGYAAAATNLVDGDGNADYDGFVTELGALEDPTVFTPAREARAREADGKLDFELEICRAAGRSSAGELVYATQDGTAESTLDYAGTDAGVVAFGSGAKTVMVSVPLVEDDARERCETLFLRGRDSSALRPSELPGVIEADGSATGPVYFERAGRIMLVRPCGEPVAIADGREPAVSPDGERLAFVREDEAGEVLVVTAPDGSGALQVFRPEAGHSLGRAAWSPDGKTLAVGEADGDPEVPHVAVWLVEATGASAKRIGEPIALAGGTLSFSPDGERLALDRRLGGGADIVTLDVATGELTDVADGQTPSYGPDGSLIYVRGDFMRILAPDGPERVFGPGRESGEPSEFGHRRPAFSPDGTAVVFEREAQNASWIVTAALAGGPPTVLTKPLAADDLHPAWGPAGVVPPPPPAVSVGDAAATEGDTLSFPVTLGGAAAGEVTVTASTDDGTAVAGSDYGASSAPVTIPAGQTQATFTVATTEDSTFEASETMAVALSGPSGATTSDGSAVGTIADDDPPPPPSVRLAAPEAVDEGGTLRFPVRLSSAATTDVMVTLSTRNGSATAPGDYTERIDDSVIFAAGQTEAFFQVQTHSDLVAEGNETVNVDIEGATGATVGSPSTAAGTIVEPAPPAPPAVRLAAPAAVDEGGTLRFPVRLSSAATTNVTVVLSTRNGSATAPGDYAARIDDSVTIPAGQAEAFFEVQTKSDLVAEANETVNVDIEGATGATVGSPSTAAGTINEVAPPRATVHAPAPVDEGGVLRFPVRLLAAGPSAVTVTLSTQNGSATAPGDYTQRITDEVVIPAGQTEAFFEVQTTDDTAFAESDETVNANIDGAAGALVGSPSSATGTIRNRPAPAASVGTPAAVDEGQPLRFPVTLSRASNGTQSVRLNTVDGTATAPGDYTARSFQDVTIPAGQTQAFFEVQTIDDPLVEGDETMKVEIRGGNNISLGSPTNATGTIRSTDLPAPEASIGPAAAVEEGTKLSFPVKLSRASNGTQTVRLNTKDGTAKAPDDYTARSFQDITIPAGQTQAMFTVDTAKDSLAETDETVTVEIRGGSNISLGSPSSASGTIQDPLPLNIVRGSFVGAETVAGIVSIKLPRTKAPLDLGGGGILPVGTIVDATEGTIELVSATATSKATLSAKTQSARFSGGIFTIRQKKASPLVTLVLSGPELRRCPKTGVRRLQADGKGAFAVQGRFATAASRSGRWLTEDRCGATTVKVQRGSAEVRGGGRAKTVRKGRALTVRGR